MKLGFGKYKDQSYENVFLRDPQYLIKTLSSSPMRHDVSAIQYINTRVLSKPKRLLMDFDRLIHSLKTYNETPEVIMYDVLKGLLSNEIIDNVTYETFKKRWTKIKHYAEDEMDPVSTFYQQYIYDLENSMYQNFNWNYEIGRFALPKNNYGIVSLSCNGTIGTKMISIKVVPMTVKLQKESNHVKLFVNGNNNETKICIESSTTINYNNIRKCIKVCETLHLLNSCKKCDKTVIFTTDYEYCPDCLNNAAQKIQCQWRECIANPKYNVCYTRLMKEFDYLPLPSQSCSQHQ
jgi:hypothetical protein